MIIYQLSWNGLSYNDLNIGDNELRATFPSNNLYQRVFGYHKLCATTTLRRHCSDWVYSNQLITDDISTPTSCTFRRFYSDWVLADQSLQMLWRVNGVCVHYKDLYIHVYCPILIMVCIIKQSRVRFKANFSLLSLFIIFLPKTCCGHINIFCMLKHPDYTKNCWSFSKGLNSTVSSSLSLSLVIFHI
jgi:hypothetical protein